MRAVRYRVLRLLRVQWRSAVGLGIAVALVGGTVLTLAAGAQRTATAPERYEAALDERWDASLQQERGLPQVDRLEALPAVDEVASATFFFGGLVPEGSEQPVEAIAFAGEREALLAEVLEGRDADPREPTEFVATRSWVELSGAEPGDRFQLLTISSETAAASGFDAPELDGPSFDATLVGVIGGAAELQDEFPLALFPPQLLGEGDIGVAASSILVSLVEGADDVELRAQLDDLPDGGQFSIGPIETVPVDLREAVSTQATALAVIAAIAAAAGLVLVGQVAVRTVRLADDQRRSLEAVGLTRADLVAEGALRVAVPAVVGVVVASGLAVAASGLFPRGFVTRIEPAPGPLVDPVVHLVGPVLLLVGLVVVVSALSAIGRRHRVARPSPVDRLTTRLGETRAAMGLRFAFARASRGNGSLTVPLVGLGVLVTMLVAAVTFGQSFVRLVDDPGRWGATYELGSGQGGAERVADEVQDAVLADPDVEALTLLGAGTAEREEDSLALTSYEPVQGQLDVVALEGEVPIGDDEIGLGAVTARDLDVGVGDRLSLRGSGDPLDLTVSGILVVPGVEGTEGLGRSGLVTVDAMTRLDPEAAMTAMAIDVRPGADVDAVRERLAEATGLDLGPFDPPGVITDYSRVRGAAWLVAALLGVLVLVSLVNLVVTTLNRRERDVAVLGSVGADRRWLTGVEHWHALALGVVVGGLGGLVGIVVGRLLFRWRITDRVGATGETAVPLVGILLGVLALVLVADLVAQARLRRRRGSVARRLAAE